ncbi:EAL domain-containing protein [Dongshaea marina]|uniref:EAL domain-containing protein n=1 Tax=Dongshaea marina TaxID=2047966 RepID=UPI000D3E43F4|nr:EAL domain-containing protein [Dongshaea marina]
MSYQILIVEDNPDDAFLTQRQLKKQGMDVSFHVVDCRDDYCRALEEKRWDAILSDYNLTDFTGGDALALYKETELSCPFIMVSGMIGEEKAVQLMRLGAHDYVMKNNLERLPGVLERELGEAKVRQERIIYLEKLKESELRHRNLISMLPDGIALVSQEAIFYLNDTAQHILKQTHKSLPQSFASLLMPDCAEFFTNQLAELFETGLPFDDLEVKTQSNLDDQRLLRISGRLHNDGGQSSAQLVFRDITDHRENMFQLRLWKHIKDYCTEGIMVLSSSRSILLANRACCTMTGYLSAELEGQDYRFLHAAIQPTCSYQEMWNSLELDGYWQGQIICLSKDGAEFPVWMTFSCVSNQEGDTTHYIAMFVDISEKEHTRRKIEYLVSHDPITSLPNREQLMELLRIRTQDSRGALKLRPSVCVCIRFQEFDKFLALCGIQAGDQAISDASVRLGELVEWRGELFYFGSQEFVIVTDPSLNESEVILLLDKIQSRLAEPYLVEHQDMLLSTVLGVSWLGRDAFDAEEAISHAQAALQIAESQSEGLRFFEADENDRLKDSFWLQRELRQALSRQEFELVYQAKADARTGDLVGAEALIRWHHPRLGLIPPGRFVPIAETTGSIIDIGQWIIDQCCLQIRQWLDDGLVPPCIAVNVAAPQICQGTLFDDISKALLRHGLNGTALGIEVTESLLIGDPLQAKLILSSVRELGVQIYLDDFGTGYSSLTYLSELPIDNLKIDQSFIADVTKNRNNAVIALATIDLAHRLGCKVTAEGVEDEGQLDFLNSNQCDEIQGYLLSQPLSPNEFCERFLKQGVPLQVLRTNN